MSEKIKWNVRIKSSNNKNQILDSIEKITDLEKHISNLVICITPYKKITNVINYLDESNKEKSISIDLSEDINSLVRPLYNTEDFKFVKDYDSLDDFLSYFESLFNFKVMSHKVNLEFYIDYTNDYQITINKSFLKFLFQTFYGDIFLYGNKNTYWDLPEGDIILNSLTIERGNLRLNKINLFRINSFHFSNINIFGLNNIPEVPCQLILYAKNSSVFENINITNSIRIGISGEVETQYKWLQSILKIQNISIDFLTDSDKDKPYEHIIKLDNFCTVQINNFFISKSMSKLIPIKFDRCPNVNIINYQNLNRNKNSVELYFKKVYNLFIDNLKVITEEEPIKTTSVITILDQDQGGEISLTNIEIQNNDFISLSNVKYLNFDVSDLNITSKNKVFKFNNDIYIDSFNIISSKIYSKEFNLEKLKNVFIDSSTIKSDKEMKISVFSMNFTNSEFITLDKATFETAGYEANQDENAKLSFNDSGLTATNDIYFISNRKNSELILNRTKIKAKNYFDKSFQRVSLKESEFITYTGLFESVFYQIKDNIFNSKFVSKKEKAFLFKGDLTGSLIFKYTNNENISFAIEREEMFLTSRNDLKILFDGNGYKLQTRIDLINSCTNILYKSNGKSFSDVNLYIVDKSKESYFYTTGITHYVEKPDLINIYLKSTSVEEMKNVLFNDGSKEYDEEKFNYGVEP